MPDVLIIGGGIAGLQTALHLSARGVDSLIIEQRVIAGGKRAALLASDHGAEPAHSDDADHAELGRRAANDPRIELRTQTRLDQLTGSAGRFTATLHEQARFVTTDCTSCAHCVAVCPESVPSEFDAGLTWRKAIHGFPAGSLPEHYAIDITTCLNDPPNYLPCQRCSDVCDDHAIDFSMQGECASAVPISAVVIATGHLDRSAVEDLAEFGYGTYPDIIDTVELRRLLESPGPSGGYAVRPSTEDYPESVLLVLPAPGDFAIHTLARQAHALRDQDIQHIELLILDPPQDNPALQPVIDAVNELQIEMHWAAWLGAQETDTQDLEVQYVDLQRGTTHRQRADLVVLATAIKPAPLPAGLAPETNATGYVAINGVGESSVPGLYAVGGVTGVYTVDETLAQARAAADDSLRFLPAPAASAVVTNEATQPDWRDLPGPEQQRVIERLLHQLIDAGAQ